MSDNNRAGSPQRRKGAEKGKGLDNCKKKILADDGIMKEVFLRS